MPRSMTITALALAALTATGPAEARPFRDAAAVAAGMHRGVNVLGYDPIWNDPAKARFKSEDFKVIRAAGFDVVRIVLQSFRHMDAGNRLPAQWLQTLDRMVAAARAAGLTVILDEHDFDACSAAVDPCRTKLLAFWSQVAPRYADQPDTVLFELLNEPHDKLDGEPWNALLAETLAVVRRTNTTRTVVIGPSFWNSYRHLDLLKLPEDDHNIIVTIHYYEPMEFTHQGASWTPFKPLSGVVWGSPADREKLGADFVKAAAWGEAHHRPMFLGEFGAYEGSGTPVELRAAYTGAVARMAEAKGMSWAYWQFEGSFGVYDIASGQWLEPIKRALLPAASPTGGRARSASK